MKLTIPVDFGKNSKLLFAKAGFALLRLGVVAFTLYNFIAVARVEAAVAGLSGTVTDP